MEQQARIEQQPKVEQQARVLKVVGTGEQTLRDAMMNGVLSAEAQREAHHLICENIRLKREIFDRECDRRLAEEYRQMAMRRIDEEMRLEELRDERRERVMHTLSLCGVTLLIAAAMILAEVFAK